jgi:hypothetical protein
MTDGVNDDAADQWEVHSGDEDEFSSIYYNPKTKPTVTKEIQEDESIN